MTMRRSLPCKEYDAVVAMRERTPFPGRACWRGLPNLRLIVTTGMANAAIDLEAARENGVTVCGTRGTVGPAAELAWGLLLALMRNIPAESESLRSGSQQWQHTVGRDLAGQTLGVVGLGKLGRLVAGYGKAFGMDVIGWNRSRRGRQMRRTRHRACSRRSTISSRGRTSSPSICG